MVRVEKSLTNDSGSFSLSVQNTDFQRRPAHVVIRCDGKVLFEGVVTHEQAKHLHITVESVPAELRKGPK